MVKDDRDLMVALAPFHDCARRIGLDPGAVFAEAAARGPASVADVVQTFGARTDVTPKAFGFVLRKTPDGPEYAWDPCVFRSTLRVDADLMRFVAEIVESDLTQSEWGAIESDDMFQRGSWTGGFDADERAFVFSHRDERGELWFQFTLAEARDLASGRRTTISARAAEL